MVMVTVTSATMEVGVKELVVYSATVNSWPPATTRYGPEPLLCRHSLYDPTTVTVKGAKSCVDPDVLSVPTVTPGALEVDPVQVEASKMTIR